MQSKQVSLRMDSLFRSYLVEGAEYAGDWEIPVLHGSDLIPNRIIPFSEAIQGKDYDAWVAFYEYDEKFLRIWRSPKKYLPILKRFRGVISPDFSLYRSMPVVMQAWMTYISRALACWWEKNGIEVIPNVRFADKSSYPFVFSGIRQHAIVSVGTHGCWKCKEDRYYFKIGFQKMIEALQPKCVIVYGKAPDSFFRPFRMHGIEIIRFASQSELFYAGKAGA